MLYTGSSQTCSAGLRKEGFAELGVDLPGLARDMGNLLMPLVAAAVVVQGLLHGPPHFCLDYTGILSNRWINR